MESVSRKSHPGMPDATGKVKRSEFEDSTKRSLDREGIRLNNTLKQYDKARRVVKKGLESDERQTAKFTQRIHATQHSHGPPLRLDMESSGSQGTSPLTTPRSDTTLGRTPRARSARAAPGSDSGVKEKKIPTKEESLQGGAGENRQQESVSNGSDDNADAASARPKLAGRQISRTELFNNLSKPKHRSDVMTIRARLREEFDSPKPQMSRGFLDRSITCPDMATMYGRSAYSHLTLNITPRGRPVRKPEGILAQKSSQGALKNTELSPVTYPNGQPLTEDDIHTLLEPPTPVIVKREEKPH